MYRLYLAAAVPRMLYAADVFLIPRLATAETGQPNETAEQSLISYGGMSTTADDVLDVLSNLFPFHLLIEKYRHQAAPARISHCINLNKWTP